jgi:alkylation response protein AidB-like acyl-CoA dehydrogenase
MEAMTTVTAGLIDRGLEDYMLETAMLKVYSTETLWTIVNDAFQIHGGAAYFTDRPLERMLRDHRINQIGEGANEVLTSFIALVGMRQPGEGLRDTYNALRRPWAAMPTLGGFLAEQVRRRAQSPTVPVRSLELQSDARALGRRIGRFGLAVQGMLIQHREEVLERQLVHERIATAAMELYASACVLSRRDAELTAGTKDDAGASWHASAARLFLKQSARNVDRALRELSDHDDQLVVEAARAALQGAAN